MPENIVIEWEGASGRVYQYWVYSIDDFSFKAEPGNYIFAKETKPDTYTPIYIGQTADLSERFDAHHEMSCVRLFGATHIHAHRSSGKEEARTAEESDLIQKWHPLCNGKTFGRGPLR